MNCTRCSFEGPDWGFKSTGAQRAACLRAMGQAIEDDKDVSKRRGEIKIQGWMAESKWPTQNRHRGSTARRNSK